MGEELVGSDELRESLPYGIVKEITQVFGYKNQSYVSDIIKGEKKGNLKIIKCAAEIADIYKQSGFETGKKKILESYANIN
ncbi:hypothetical protein BTO06_00970 [Tenacibaculum sp. SZ-18]|uniref:hypothetical protein n=1 Tax=Tenacibaculum sp. SZ-18 TaxID=754423 RepID=UPI000C2D2EA0|nr:hypothetical protein [Tenacibaculum sp. SZ-18]AUC13805.1 hypothetical protein BTO06_00970 [Tenacibaculum sp. SZ-18]